MTVYEVKTRYDDRGKVKAKFRTFEADKLPENTYEETKYYDEYNDYYENKAEAIKAIEDARKA